MSVFYSSSHGTLYHGDALECLDAIPDASVQCVVTSPPYWGLRNYHSAGQIGLEDTVEAHIDALVRVFRAIRRVLREDGTLWVNYGDTYASDSKWGGCTGGKHAHGLHGVATGMGRDKIRCGLPDKNLIGLPWRLAFALQADGWFLRSDIIWAKPNPMPESVRDRPTRAHEYIFLLSRNARYYYDAEAVREPVAAMSGAKAQCARALTFARHVNEPQRPGHNMPQHRPARVSKNANSFRHGGLYTHNASLDYSSDKKNISSGEKIPNESCTRNRRTVWTIPTYGCPYAHFATFPSALVAPCILAGSRRGDTVLDPFMGSGTVGMVARRLGRRWLGCEINAEYCALALKRIDVTRLSLLEMPE